MGIGKGPMSTVSAPVLAELGLAMMEGARKYGRHNYRCVGVRASVYYDAALRHLTRWYEGEDIDPDSGLSHVIKAMACMAVVRDSMIVGNWVDDRPPVAVDNSFWQGVDNHAKEMIQRYPEQAHTYTQQENPL